MNLHKHHILR